MAILLTDWMLAALADVAAGGGSPSFNPIDLNPILSLAPGVNVYQDTGSATAPAAFGDNVREWNDERAPTNSRGTFGYFTNLRGPGVWLPTAFGGGPGVQLAQDSVWNWHLPAAHPRNDLTLLFSGVMFTDDAWLESVTTGAFFTDQATPSGLLLNFGGKDGANPPYKGGFSGWWGGTGGPPAGYQADLITGPQIGPVPVVLTMRWQASSSVLRANGVTSAALGPAYNTTSQDFYFGSDNAFDVSPNRMFKRRMYLFPSSSLTDSQVTQIEAFMAADLGTMNLWPNNVPFVGYLGDSLIVGPLPQQSTWSDQWAVRGLSALTGPYGYLIAGGAGMKLTDLVPAYLDSGDFQRWHSAGRTAAQLVYFLCGHNDLAAAVSGTDVYNMTKAAVGQLTTAGLQVCLVAVPPSNGFSIAVGSEYQIYRGLLRGDFGTPSGSPYLFNPSGGTTYAASLLDPFADPALANPAGSGYTDQTHFSSTGQAEMQSIAQPFMASHSVT